jgi:putative acetyltransferase
MKIALREVVEADAERIHEIHCSSVRVLCATVYSSEIIEGWLKNRSPEHYRRNMSEWGFYVAEAEEKTVGFGGAVPGEIIATYVDPDYSRHGVGTALMSYGLKKAKVNAPGIIKIDSTMNARTFYETFGFKVVGEFMMRRNDVEFQCFHMEKAGGTE